MDEAKIRAWWSAKQGLDGSLSGRSAGEVLEQTGWARSVGGANPYLALFARAGIARETADAAVEHREIHELPGARGCTYVVPARDFALALKAGQGFADESEMKTARKLGVTDGEIDKLRGAVQKALAKESLDPEALREAVGGAVRNLGAEGKKKGMVTTLPLALGKLQSAGEIRRVSVNGRLDRQRYRYAAWPSNPLKKFKLSSEETYTELARRYFSWIGPATLAEFQWFSGLGAKAARTAADPLKLVPLENGGERLLFADDRERLKSFKAPRESQYSLVAGLDNISHLRRDVQGLLDAQDRRRRVFVERGFEEAGGLTDLPSHAIVDRGRLVGLWEYDTGTESIAWVSFIPGNKALEAAVEKVEGFVRSQLADARSFSLDSPRSRAPRIEALRKAASA